MKGAEADSPSKRASPKNAKNKLPPKKPASAAALPATQSKPAAQRVVPPPPAIEEYDSSRHEMLRNFVHFARYCYRVAPEVKADAYLAHGVEAMPAADVIAQAVGGRVYCDVIDSPSFRDRGGTYNWHPTDHLLLEHAFDGYLRNAAGLSTVSWTLGREIERYGRPVTVIPNYRCAEELHPSTEIRTRCGLGPGDILLLASSTIYSGFEPVLEALKLLPDNVHLATFGVIVGHCRERVLAYPAELGIQNRVHFSEEIPYEQLTAMASGANLGLIALNPDILNHWWSVPNRLFDYMAAGLPIVTPNLPDVARIVNERQIGSVVARNEASCWAQAIKSALRREKQMRPRVRQAAKELAWEAVEDELRSAYGNPASVTIVSFQNLIDHQRTLRMATTLVKGGATVTICCPEHPQRRPDELPGVRYVFTPDPVSEVARSEASRRRAAISEAPPDAGSLELVNASDDTLRVSFGTVDVTPDRPLPLFGYARREKPFSRVASTIELDVAVLRWRDRTLVLLTGDFLYLSGTLRDAIVAMFGPRYGFTTADVLLGASHSHFAPAIDPSKPGLGLADPGYIDFVHTRALALVGELLNSAGEPATIRHCRRPSRHNCNRRSVVLRDDGQLTIDDVQSDPGNTFDDALDVLRFDGTDGQLRGAIVRYACHPTSFGELLALTAEFPGVIRAGLRTAAEQPDVPILFFQGFAGDMVPINPPREEVGPASSRRRFQAAPRQPIVPVPDWEQWASSLAADARLAFDEARNARPLVPLLSAVERRMALPELIEELGHQQSGRFMSMQAIELSAELLIVALSAEPTAAWTELVSDLAPGRTVLPVGYANQTFGYLPVGRELEPHGYMAGGFFRPFGLTGRFRRDIEQRVFAELDTLLAPLVRAGAPGYPRRMVELRAQIDRLRSERELARALYLATELQSAAGP